MTESATENYVSTTPTPDTSAAQYICNLTEQRVRILLHAFGISRLKLVDVIIDQHPELKTKRHSVQAALYGKSAFPYLYELLNTLKNPA